MKLLTRADFDGLACAVLLFEKGVVDEFEFVHPKDVQDDKIKVTSNDVLANVPWAGGCGMWFDHHSSEEDRLGMNVTLDGASNKADSAAQVIWDHYGGAPAFDPRFIALVDAVNKSDSARFTMEDVLYPREWILLSFLMDPRTGLGRFTDFRISNHQLMENLISYCGKMTIKEIMKLSDVQQRADRYMEHQEFHQKMLRANCQQKGNLIITDLRECTTVYCGNRFVVYALCPKQNIELRLLWGKDKQNVVISCGHSIFNRTSSTNVGQLMLKYGGGGHRRVGTCQIPVGDVDRVTEELIWAIRSDG
ncbi:exopolyphosphatase [Candidatus Hydrogenedentota bacterium]